MPHTNHNQTHKHHGAIIPKNVYEDLENWLTNCTGNCTIEVLNREEEREDDEESK
jgi:hypothetical protein